MSGNVRKGCLIRNAENGAVLACCFSAIVEKPEGGRVLNSPIRASDIVISGQSGQGLNALVDVLYPSKPIWLYPLVGGQLGISVYPKLGIALH